MGSRLVGRERELRQVCAVLDGASAAVEINGPAGVGKSRLLREVATVAAERGWSVTHLAASHSVRSIPFGAASHLLPPGPVTDPTQLLRAAREQLRRRAGDGRLLLTVDDAHELDDSSAALVRQTLVHDSARVVMTARSDAPVPDAVTLLRSDGSLTRVDLGGLPRADANELAGEVLGGRPDPELLDALWRLTRGHPLYLVVALEAARDAGAVAPDGDRWTLVGPLLSRRLHELVLARVRRLDDAAGRTLEVIAVAEPVERRHIAGLVDDGAVGLLVDRGLVVVDTAGGGPVLSTAHPVYAEVVRAAMTPNRAHTIAGALADAVASDIEAGPGERMRAAMWALDSGRPVTPGQVLDGAKEALRRADYGLAERLAAAALAGEPGSAAAAAVLGRALGSQGRPDEALDALDAAEPTSEQDRGELALVRGHTLAFALGRPDEAATVLAVAAETLPDAHRWQLDAERALYSAITGDFAATVEAAGAALSNPGTPPPAQLTAYTNLTLAQSMTGRLDGFDDAADEGARLADEHEQVLPLAGLQIELSRASAWCAAGRIADAHALCERRVADAERAGVPDPMELAWLGVALGMRGRLEEAAARQEQAIALFALGDPFRLRSQSVGLWVMHLAQAGHPPPDADDLLARAAAEAGPETRLSVWIGRGAAWLAARHDVDAGARLAAATGQEALTHDHLVWGAWALHDAVRMGRPDGVAALLEDAVAATSGARLLETMRDQAVALAAGDAPGLGKVGWQLHAHGSPLYAAEAFAQEARCWEAGADPPAAARAAVLAGILRRQCSGARTPALRDVPGTVSDRELQIAVLAPERTSREIADALFLSVRTVDNHLRSVYRKLGLPGREALAELLAGVRTGPSDSGGLHGSAGVNGR